jgi:hypothetical protein
VQAASSEPTLPDEDKKFDALEKDINTLVKSTDKLWEVWNRIDGNGNGKVPCTHTHMHTCAFVGLC